MNVPARVTQPPQPCPPAGLFDTIVLDDGRRVAVRAMHAHDADAEQRFVRGLSLVSRQRRFHIGLRELAPELLRQLTDVDQRRHVAVLAEAFGDDGQPQFVADARYVRGEVFGERAGEAEFALTVADAWQGLGLGRALLQRLLEHARASGVTRVWGDVLHANLPMIGLVRRLGGRFVAVPGDATLTRAVYRFDDAAALPPRAAASAVRALQ